MAGLEQELTGQLSEYEGEWSVYVKNLSTDETFVLNDQPMKSASVMKLFIMGTVYKAFECGELERTEEIMSLMNKMISYSDNASSNEFPGWGMAAMQTGSRRSMRLLRSMDSAI